MITQTVNADHKMHFLIRRIVDQVEIINSDGQNIFLKSDF